MEKRWALYAAGLLLVTVPVIGSNAFALPTPLLLAQADSPSELYQVKAEQFIDLVFSRRYDEALQYLHPVLQREIGDMLAERVKNFESTTGPFQERQETQVEGNVVLVNTQFENLTDTIIVIFDQEGLITGVDFPIQPLRSL
jgi:hypothetical protein